MKRPFNVFAGLAARYSGPEWAYFPELRNGVGYARGPRTADAVAMSLWPSRGLVLHGFEVKSARSDWLREKKDPEKAEESFFSYCDYWWIVVDDPAIVAAGELPPTWGLLVPRGAKLVVSREAPRLSPAPLSRLVVASLLKRAKDYGVPPEVARVREEKLARDCRSVAEAATRRAIESTLRERDDLRASIRAFEEASGVHLDRYEATRIGRRLRALVDGKSAREEADVIRRRLRAARHSLEDLERLDAEYRALLAEAPHATGTEPTTAAAVVLSLE